MLKPAKVVAGWSVVGYGGGNCDFFSMVIFSKAQRMDNVTTLRFITICKMTHYEPFWRVSAVGIQV